MQHPDFVRTIKRLAVLSGFCAAYELARMLLTQGINYIFLPWNLILAWVPLVLALQVRKERSAFKLVIYLMVWFIFFPNAPYIITDFIHLKPRDNFPFWYDSILVYSYAFTGLMLGIVSALIVYNKLHEFFSGQVAKWVMAVVMFLSGYGIYVGRFLRYNSWNVLTDPLGILAETIQRLIHPTNYPRTYRVTLMTGILMCLVFAVLESIMQKNER